MRVVQTIRGVEDSLPAMTLPGLRLRSFTHQQDTPDSWAPYGLLGPVYKVELILPMICSWSSTWSMSPVEGRELGAEMHTS